MTKPLLRPAPRVRTAAGAVVRWRPRSTTALWVAVVSLVLSLFYFRTTWTGDPSTTWAGNIGDPEQNQWFLAWVPYAITHGLDPFVTHHVLYPSGANLMWNTSDIFPALVMSPVTLLFGPTVTYNLILLLGPPTASLAAYAAFRRWVSPWAAAAGGLLFGFCPFFFRQMQDHLHLSVIAFVPLLLLVLDEIVVRQRWSRWLAGAALGLVALAQYLSSTELFALDVLVAVIGVVILMVAYRARVASKLRYAVTAFSTGALVFLALGAYPLWEQLRGPLRVPQTIHSPNVYVNDVMNIVAPVGQLFTLTAHAGMSRGWTGNAGEWNGYLGLPLLLVVVTAVALYRRRPIVWFSAALLLVVEVLSLGPWLHVDGHVTRFPLPWAGLAHLPFMNNALPNRLAVYADLLVALLFAVVVDALVRRLREPAPGPDRLSRFGWLRRRQLQLRTVPWPRPVLGVVVAAVALAWVPAAPAMTTVTTPAYFGAQGGIHDVPAGTVAVVLPWVQGPGTEHAELWQARAGMPVMMPEGYMIVPGNHAGPMGPTYQAFSYISAGSHAFPTTLSRDLAEAVRVEWQSWGVGLVVVGPGFYDQRVVAQMVSQVLDGAQPRWTQGVAVFDVPG